jgi:acetyl esterase/lipase
LSHLIEYCRAANKNLAIFVLTYTLAPTEQYPTQLIQSVEALRFILTETSRRPSQVVLGGDSAGGNLVFGVLSHLAHGHPDIAELKISEPLAGAATIAPWTTLKAYPDYKPIVIGDLLTTAVAGPWSSAYVGSAERDFYTDPHTARSDWFVTYPAAKILVTAGGNEILLPFIREFVDNLRV